MINIPRIIPTLRRVRKTVTFTGAAGAGAVGTIAVFTLTGRVIIDHWTAFCTTLLASAGGGSIQFGTDGLGSADFIAATTATEIDADEWWNDNSPEVENTLLNANQGPYAINDHMIIEVTTADVTSGVIVFDAWYEPITDNGLLVAA